MVITSKKEEKRTDRAIAYDNTPTSPARKLSDHIHSFHRNFADSPFSGSAVIPYDTRLHSTKDSHHIRNSGLMSLGDVMVRTDQTICVVLENNTPCAFSAEVL